MEKNKNVFDKVKKQPSYMQYLHPKTYRNASVGALPQRGAAELKINTDLNNLRGVD